MRTRPIRSAACILAAMVLTASAAPAVTFTPAQRCERAKIIARTKYDACLARLRQVARINGQPINGGSLTECGVALQRRLRAAGTCRMVDNGDGTVTDLDTGLMWELKTAANVSDTYDWPTAAGEYVSQRNGVPLGSSLGGFHDWHLPSTGELLSLVSIVCALGAPCVVDPGIGPTAVGAYWAIETAPSDPAQAVHVDFDVGGLANVLSPKSTPKFVRAVRSAFEVGF